MKTTTKIITAGLGFAFGAALCLAAPASENWDNHCAKCHGADGTGQTRIGKKLHLKDYTDAAVQAKFTDEQLTKDITEGVTVDGKEKMKPFKDQLTTEEIKDLVSYIRAFKH